MSYEPFHERFREIAEKETRTLIAINDPDLPDGEYGKRIKRHYEMFRASVDEETVEESTMLPRATKERIARNAPCPCGSGTKYKKCCGK